ncbi:MAG TPA: hypothetical protein VGO43_15885 [Pyrinomonadaceae bacterium]|nr:hypothetical protein [Pyrinomonadaceae bacterium]
MSELITGAEDALESLFLLPLGDDLTGLAMNFSTEKLVLTNPGA